MQQWHLGLEYQLPADTVLEVSYAGSRGLKLFAFYNGNQVPGGDTNASDPTAPRRPAHGVTPGATGDQCTLDAYYNNPAIYNCNPALDASIATFRSNTQSNYNSLQARLEKRYSHGLQYEAAYTFAHALDNASSASLGSVNNGDFRDQTNPIWNMAMQTSTCVTALCSAIPTICLSAVAAPLARILPGSRTQFSVTGK